MTEPRPRQTIEPAGFFVMRTPLAPFSDLTAWSEGLAALDADEPARGEALAADRRMLRARLAAYVQRPEIQEALFIASPSLDEALAVWSERPDSERGQRVERALVRYVARLAGRATPFGLFAGCSVGTIGAETRLEISARSEYRRHTRLDADYLFAMTDSLVRDPALRGALTYRPNSSLYRAGDRLRYVESRIAGTLRSHHLVAVERTKPLDGALARAREGATFQDLAASLVDGEVSDDQAADFITELIDSQILIPDIGVPVTGPEPLQVLPEALAGRPEMASVARALEQTRRELEQLDAAGIGNPVERYRAVAASLESLPAKVELSRLFQVDLIKPAPQALLGAAVLDEIVRGVTLVFRLSRRGRDDRLKRFRDAFRSRYEEREVPLLEALDEEAGIGFEQSRDSAPLLAELPTRPSADESVPWGPRESHLLRKLNEALSAGREEIPLEGADIDALAATEIPPLPDAFAVSAALAAASERALARGEFRVWLHGLSGPSGALLFGRFCHADAVLRRRVEQHLRAEEACDRDAVFAEVVHLPEGRLGNILLRPVLREYEIPYLGTSGAPPERQLPITDLRVSVMNDAIVLRSERLQRRVIPRLTTAHNFSRGLGLYQFLCALQRQGVAPGGGWDWGPLARAPFLPRVTAGRLVLSRARWHVHKDELERLGRGDSLTRFRQLQAWRAERRLPRWVVLADGDNTLPVDLSNGLAVESFVHVVKGRSEATLEELFPAPDELCAHGPEGAFVHELVVPFLRNAMPSRRPLEVSAARTRVEGAPAVSVRRSFPPLSDWLYVKLYSGPAIADELLRQPLGPLARRVMKRGHARSWFFVRYEDPEPHLRLRFRGDAKALELEVWPALRRAIAPYLDDGRIWRLARDTYEREIERYGGSEGIELAEELFHADSEAVLAIVERLEPGDAGHEERWRLTVCGMHLLLDDLDLDLRSKLSLLQRVRGSFAKEQGLDRDANRRLSEKFRKERSQLERLLDSAVPEGPLAPGVRILRDRSRRWKRAADELKARQAAGRLTRPIPELAGSYLHMHANRLLRAAQREQEAVLYDLLARHYESEVARCAPETAYALAPAD